MSQLELLKEMQSLAQAGMFYARDVFDLERFTRMREIAQTLMAQVVEVPLEQIQLQFEGEIGYQTPKVSTRAVVWKDHQLLLVQEADGRWCLPGGWCDVTGTISDNVEKELREEAGVVAKAQRLLMVLDRGIHHPGQSLFTIHIYFVECQLESMVFEPNSETLDARFFDVNHLPELYEEKTSHEAIMMCLEARKQGEEWKTVFD